MLAFRGKHKVQVRTTLVDDELAGAMRELLALPKGGRVFRFEADGRLVNLTSRHLNEYVKAHMGAGLHGKGFPNVGRDAARGDRLRRARGPHGFPETPTDAKRSVAAVMRGVANCSATHRPSAAPRTSRPRSSTSISTGERSRISGPAICASSVRGRSGSTGRSRHCSACSARSGFDRRAQQRRFPRAFRLHFRPWHGKQFSFATTAAKRSTRCRARSCA